MFSVTTLPLKLSANSMASEKKLVEAWAIVEVPQTHKFGLTSVPMREKDVGQVQVCSVYINKEDAEHVVYKSIIKGVQIVPCFVTYRQPNEKPQDQ